MDVIWRCFTFAVIHAPGENAVRVLLDILNGGNGAPEQVTLPHTLVVRASTACTWTMVNALAVEFFTNT